MKLKFTILAIITISIISSIAQAAAPEFRALWVHNWRNGLLCPSEVDETVRWAKDCNMNVLIVQVRRVGDAYYDSAYEPRATNISGGSDFDPLACVIKQAKSNNLEVHAWFNLFRIWTPSSGIPDAKHVASLHPEWLSKDVNGSSVSPDGQFLDPGVPEVREYLVKLVSDLMGKYDVDGLMLDFVRYPGSTWGYNDTSIALFNAKYGRFGNPSPTDPQWCTWRRHQVTETVKAIYNEAHRLKPSAKVSAATIAWGDCPSDFTKTSSYKSVFQDWRAWMCQGILDANMPMNYKDPSKADHRKSYVNWLNGAKRWSYGRHVYCGLMAFSNQTSGAASQVKLARDRGIQGIVGFAFSQLDQPLRSKLASKLKSSVFANSAPVPVMPWKENIAQKPADSKKHKDIEIQVIKEAPRK